MEVVFDRVAGLDVGKASVTVCVRTPRPAGQRGSRRVSQTRTFKTTTGALAVMRAWLVESGVTIAAMESTSTYWRPVFYALEEHMTCWLLNAAHMKAVPGRKTDVRDAEWIAQLLEHGLLRPSFVPPPAIRHLRMLTRYRVQLMGDRTREVTRLEQMLEDASIKLSTVASSLTTVSARAMLEAMVAGERDPAVLAEMAEGKMRSKIPDLREALDGHFTHRHARLVDALLDRLTQVDAALLDLDDVIDDACRPWAHQLELLQTIPGVGPKVAQIIIAETGADMRQFPTASHLVAWAGLAPGLHESAGRRRPRGCGTATSGSARGWSRPPPRSPAPRTPTSPPSTRGSPAAAAGNAPRSRSPTRSWSRRSTCSAVTSPTATSDRTGCTNATTKPTPADWSLNSSGSATPSPSTPRPPDRRHSSRPSWRHPSSRTSPPGNPGLAPGR